MARLAGQKVSQARPNFDCAFFKIGEINGMSDVKHLALAELEAGLDEILRSPKSEGSLEMIVRRPQTGEREILETAELNLTDGLAGDNWKARSSPEKPANPAMQITIMNARVIALLTPDKSRHPLAGDQLYVDFDLSVENLPAGAQLGIGTAILEISPQLHTGCKKFLARFGEDALQFVNSPQGKQLRLRGLNARIVRPGVVRKGDKVRKLAQP